MNANSAAAVLELLVRHAPIEVAAVDRSSDRVRLNCTFSLQLPDGTPETFHLVIEVLEPEPRQGLVVTVREAQHARRLPGWCPERHLIEDGYFCLGFGDSAPALPRDERSARSWWRHVGDFLRLQIRASLTREWPPEHAWPHGDRAALLQWSIDWSLPLLPEELRNALASGNYALASERDRVCARRSACGCGSGRQVRHCHEPDIVHLLQLIRDRDNAQLHFWTCARNDGRVCCKTMNVCGMEE